MANNATSPILQGPQCALKRDDVLAHTMKPALLLPTKDRIILLSSATYIDLVSDPWNSIPVYA